MLPPGPTVGYSAAMTVTLCIETSSAYCSVALRVSGQDYSDHRHLQRQHNQFLLEMLDGLISQAGCNVSDIQVIGFGCGPGSFTGVRIAAAVTQAIGFVAEARIVPVASSRVWFEAARHQLSEQQQTADWLTCVASRGEAYYLSHLRCHSNQVEQPRQDALYEQAPAWLISQVKMTGHSTNPAHAPRIDQTVSAHGSLPEAAQSAWTIIGQIPPWLPADLYHCVRDNVTPDARCLLDHVDGQHAQGMSVSADQAIPRYVSGDSPWKKSHR